MSLQKGTQGRKHWTFGYKAHVVADCRYELPVAVHITTATERVRAHVDGKAIDRVACFPGRYLVSAVAKG